MLLVLGILLLFIGGGTGFMIALANGMSDAPGERGIPLTPSLLLTLLGLALVVAWFKWGGTPISW